MTNRGIRSDWPNKHPGDHMDADGMWRNTDGDIIGIKVEYGGVIYVDGPVYFPGNVTTPRDA